MRSVMDDPMVLESGLPYPKMLDKSVLAARAKAMQEVVSENGVVENVVVGAAASGDMEVTEQVGGMEASARALTYRPEHDGVSNHGDGAQTEAAQEEGLALPTKPSEGYRVMEQPFEGCGGSSSLSSPKAGNDNAAKRTAVGQKKRKDWNADEADKLLNAFRNYVGTRMDRCTSTDSYWDAIAKEVPGRTGDGCRRRMDTLKKSYSNMKKYRDEHQKEFQQLTEKDFRDMKLATRLTENWYEKIRDHCPPRPKTKRKTDGDGGLSKSSDFVPDTSTLGRQAPILTNGIGEGEATFAVLEVVFWYCWWCWIVCLY